MSVLATVLVVLLCMESEAGQEEAVVLDIPMTVGSSVSNMGTQGENGVPVSRYSTTFTLPALPIWGYLARSRAVAPDSLVPLTTFHYKSETQVFLEKGRLDLARDALLLLQSVSADSAVVVGEIRLVGDKYRVVRARAGFPAGLKLHIQGDRPALPGRP